MPIAAFLGAMLFSALLLLMQWTAMKMRGGFSEDGWYYLYILPIIQSAVFGYSYARISCWVAPSGKLVAGIVMVTVLLLLASAILILTWLLPDMPLGESVRSTIGVGALGIASVVGLLAAKDEDNL